MRGLSYRCFFFDQIIGCFSATTFEPKEQSRLTKKIPSANMKATTKPHAWFNSIGIRLSNQTQSHSLQELLLKSSLVPKVSDCFFVS